MLSPYQVEQIENWASEFAEDASLTPGEKGIAPSVALEFLKKACEIEDVGPADIGEKGASAAVLNHLPSLQLPPAIRPRVPEIVALFLETLQSQGRLAGGASLGTFVRALGPAFRERCAPDGGVRVPPVRNAATPIGRNDPCPCGSGKKYKKCCGGTK